MKEKLKKLGAPIIGLALLGGGIGAGFAMDSPDTIVEEKIINETIEVEKVVEVEVPVEVEVIKEIDNGNLDLVLTHLYDNDGNVEYLLDDLDDDEIDEIVDRVIFINEVKKLAVDYVKKEGVDELDKELVGEVELDEDEIERFKVDDDDEDLIIDDVDFEYGDAEVLVTVKFEQDDVKYGAVFNVEFEDGEAEDIDLEELYERE